MHLHTFINNQKSANELHMQMCHLESRREEGGRREERRQRRSESKTGQKRKRENMMDGRTLDPDLERSGMGERKRGGASAERCAQGRSNHYNFGRRTCPLHFKNFRICC